MIRASIVTYHSDFEELGTCLRCIDKCPQISAIDVIDNGHDPGMQTFLSQHFPHVTYISNANIGYGAAHNISIKRTLSQSDRYRFHLVLNSDIIFEKEVIDILLEKLNDDESIGLIMPSVKNKDNTPQSCSHPLPTPLDLLLHRFAPSTWFKGWRRRYDLIPDKRVGDINVPYMHGCFMLFRTTALENVGLFDERFFMYPEDIDITRRVHAKYKTIATPDVSIIHHHRAASRHNIRMLFIHATNMLRYFAKWGYFFDSERRTANRELRKLLKEKGY